MNGVRSCRGGLGRWLLAAGLGFGAIGCAPPSTPPASGEFGLTGCQYLVERSPGERECVLWPEVALTVWLAAGPQDQVEWSVDGRPQKAESEVAFGGQRFRVAVPEGAARRVELAWQPAPAASGSPRPRITWHLWVRARGAEEPVPVGDQLQPTRDAYDEVHQAIAVGDLVGARARLEPLQPPADAPAEVAYLPAFYRAQLATREGDYRTAFVALAEAEAQVARVGHDTFVGLAQEERALLLLRVGRFTEAVALLAQLRERGSSSDDPTGLANNEAWARLMAREAGEPGGDPWPALDQALEGARGPGERRNFELNRALAALREGDLVKVRAALAAADPGAEVEPVEEQLWRLDLTARLALVEGRVEAAKQAFAELDTRARASGQAEAELRAALGAARTARVQGDLNGALAHLRHGSQLLDRASLQVPIHQGRNSFVAQRQALVLLGVDTELAAGRPAAALAAARRSRRRVLVQLERAERFAALDPAARAEYIQRMNRYAEARAALEAAAAEDWQRPRDQLQQELAQRAAAVAALDAELDVALARAGVLAAGTREELAPLAPGELLLTFHPLPAGWAAFAASGELVAVQRFSLDETALRDTSVLARRLLEPFRAEILAAKQVRVLPYGPLTAVDFHALLLDGKPLLAHRPVVYGLDGPPRGPQPALAAGRALVVSDPQGDLPESRVEGRAVLVALRARGRSWQSSELAGGAATAAAVRAALPGLNLFHYAGHGNFGATGGFGFDASGLRLAAGSRLTLADLLALPEAPAWVTLAGCETARGAEERAGEGLSLAHAFLLAGARGVVASTRPVEDRTTADLMAEFYPRLLASNGPAAAFQQALLAWRQRHPGVDWASFRYYEP